MTHDHLTADYSDPTRERIKELVESGTKEAKEVAISAAELVIATEKQAEAFLRLYYEVYRVRQEERSYGLDSAVLAAFEAIEKLEEIKINNFMNDKTLSSIVEDSKERAAEVVEVFATAWEVVNSVNSITPKES